MTTVWIIALTVVYGVLVVVRAMRPSKSSLSNVAVMTLHRLWEFSLVAATSLLAVAAFGWPIGVLTTVGLLLLLGLLARFKPVVKLARHYCWPRHEALLMVVAKKYPGLVKLFRGLADTEASQAIQFSSRQEFLNVIAQANSVVSSDEKQLLKSVLAFSDLTVRDVMTPRKDIISIAKDEMLGPLTLTALHKTKRSHLPVVHGGLDNVIGVFAASEFLNTERQGEITVEDVMGRRIFYINEAQSLHEALQALLHTKAHLFIVVDKHEKTVGIITISDVIEAVFGRVRDGKYQQYEDVHATALLGAAVSHTSTTTKKR